jgi:hypothetical protein
VGASGGEIDPVCMVCPARPDIDPRVLADVVGQELSDGVLSQVALWSPLSQVTRAAWSIRSRTER